MPRIPAVNMKKADGFAIEILNQMAERLGRIPNLPRVIAHSPAALGAVVEIEKRLRAGALEPQLRELAALETARLVGHVGERRIREELARRAGIEERKIAELDGAASSDAYSPREKALLRYADEAMRPEGPSEGAMAGLAIHFSHAQEIELSLVVALASWAARFARDFQVEEREDTADSAAQLMRSCGS